MTSVADQIKIIEQDLKKQAQLLGLLNLKNNDYLQSNEKLARQIVDLRTKVAKKKHLIEQQNKDKMIIHQKLIKAQREKQLLQIQKQTVRTPKKPESPESLPRKPFVTPEVKPMTELVKQESSVTKSIVKPDSKPDIQPSNIDESEHYAGQGSTGGYQPPMLFSQQPQQQSQKSQSQQSEDQDDILAKLRQKAQGDQDGDEEDD